MGRRLAAILAAEFVGYSLLVANDAIMRRCFHAAHIN